MEDSPPGPVLRDTLRRVASPSPSIPPHVSAEPERANTHLPPANAHQIIGEEGVPLIWAYFALREGYSRRYPGHAPTELPAGYDPDSILGIETRRAKWQILGSPYRDSTLARLAAVLQHVPVRWHGQLLGVAGIDIALSYVIDRLMLIPDPRMVESFLLDQEGRIVIRSSDKDRDPAEVAALANQGASPVPPPGNRCRCPGRQFRLPGTTGGWAELWIVYDDIETLGWAYVVEFAPKL